MYRPTAFAINEVPKLQAMIRERVFATIVLSKGAVSQIAYAPVILAAHANSLGSLRFHLARNNPISAAADGATLLCSFLGPDAYVSPDWYETAGMVPTWNYKAVEGRGVARRLDTSELPRLLAELTAQQEAKLRPKKPWTIDKLSSQRMDALLNAIVGFEVPLEMLEGKFKLSQNIKDQDFAGAVNGLERCGDMASIAVASEMRKLNAP